MIKLKTFDRFSIYLIISAMFIWIINKITELPLVINIYGILFKSNLYFSFNDSGGIGIDLKIWNFKYQAPIEYWYHYLKKQEGISGEGGPGYLFIPVSLFTGLILIFAVTKILPFIKRYLNRKLLVIYYRLKSSVVKK